MDGFELATRIAKFPHKPKAKLIMLTSGRSDGERSGKLRVSACLNKPVKQSELLNAITAVLTHPRPEPLPEDQRRTTLAVSRLRILVAEDNRVNQELMVHLLAKRGYEVDVANDGRAALDALSNGSFDLVLMDVQMPIMNGYEVTAAVRERERNTSVHLPIIATTAHAMTGDRARALQNGMDGYLAKPIRAQELHEMIDRLTRKTGIIDETALLEGLGGDQKLLVKLIDVFLADYPKTLMRIRRAIQADHKEALREAAHALKGAVGNFGPSRAYDLARKLELKGQTGPLRGADRSFTALKKEMSTLRQSLKDLRARASEGINPIKSGQLPRGTSTA
jgi:two-component system sensor histidine kinase/response regulator